VAGVAEAARGCMAGRCDEVGECDWRESALGAGAFAAVGLAGLVVWWRRGRA
jgi:hypothetical protein